LTKFDLSISNTLNQIHNKKISFRRHELHTDVSEYCIKGVNPIKKRKTEDKTPYYSEYESSKRVRSYSTEWEKDRPWLKLTDDGMV
jgi:hypothetical protein